MLILDAPSQKLNRSVVFAGTQDLLEDFFCIRFATANAKVMAKYLQFVFGFQEVAYKGLETGAIFEACHVLRSNDIVMEVVSPLQWIEPADEAYGPELSSSSEWEDTDPDSDWEESMERDPWFAQMLEIPKFRAFMSDTRRSRRELQGIMNEILDLVAILRFVGRHGCGVMDVGFWVSDAEKVFRRAVSNGALGLHEPAVERDSHGAVIMAVLGSPNSDVRHTIVQKIDYTGPFLPHYGVLPAENSVQVCVQEQGHPPAYTPISGDDEYGSGLLRVDHCVQNFSWHEMKRNATFYAACFGMTKFWTVYDKDVSTSRTGLNSTVMISHNGKVKMPINEPVKVKMRGQIEEFYDFHGGPGVQHVALQTEDIVQAVEYLSSRGMTFNSIQAEYYDELQHRMQTQDIRLLEDFAQLRRLNILVDFDAGSRYWHRDGFYTCHYILQIFTKPIQDRPTFFFEIIQRRSHDGFGKGTFKGLFESIEREQMMRGTL